MAKSCNFLKVVPFLRPSSISINPPLLILLNLSIVYSHFMIYWVLIIRIQTWNQRMSCLSIKIISIFTKSSKLLKVIPFFWSTSISINPPLFFFFNLNIVDSHLMINWVLIIRIQTWNQRISCIVVKFLRWMAKSCNFLKVIPFFRTSSVSIYPPFWFVLSF